MQEGETIEAEYGSEHDLAKSRWPGGRKAHTNKTVRKKTPKTGELLPASDPPPDAKQSAAKQPAAKQPAAGKASQWTVVTKGRKTPRVQKGYSVDKGDAGWVNLNRERNPSVYTGEPTSRQNRKEFVIRAELQERSLTDKKLVYVSRYNKGQEKKLQRR